MNIYQSLGITHEEFETLQEAFKLYDVEQKGYISTEQFSDILTSLGIITQPQQIAHIVDAADIDHDNKIGFHEFVLAMFNYLPHQPEEYETTYSSILSEKNSDEEEIMSLFRFFDLDHDGRISQKELEQAMKRLDARLTPHELREMMITADTNRDGFVDFDEFKNLLPPL
ncbi:hypothetical protein EDC96DRAFT_497700 [Choanephora cucurbitarum]|nr:hypothetical protein EDC96DRAFT_497700 [Choanephora cucurbitarum]